MIINLILSIFLGRWIAPKHSDHDSDDFSGILVSSLGVGADILELLESFGDENVGGQIKNEKKLFLIRFFSKFGRGLFDSGSF